MKKSTRWLWAGVIVTLLSAGYFVIIGHSETAWYIAGVASICFANLINSQDEN